MLSTNEVRARAAEFAREWQSARYEAGEKQTFYDEFFRVFGMKRRQVATFEEPVKKLGGKHGFIDLLWKGNLLVEHKSAGRNLIRAKEQALDYFPLLKPEELLRYVLVSDFQNFELYDLNERTELRFPLACFSRLQCLAKCEPIVNYSRFANRARRSAMLQRGLSPIYLDEREASELPMAVPRRRRNRLAFGWYGGKFSHLEWLLPLLPAAHHYCEPFSGSAAVLLNRNPAPVETYNDLDGEVVNFFRMLRDEAGELARLIALTPFSREEFHRAISGRSDNITDIERARRFYIRARQTRTGLAQTATLGRWANCKDTSRSGMSGVVSRWLNGVGTLPELSRRLLRVQIENRPATDVIRLYDSRTTLYYCDPPYLHDTRGDSKAYGFEMSEDEHIDLASVLNGCEGKVAISGYRNSLMDRLYKGWKRFDAPAKQAHSIKKLRQESVWMNY